MTEKVGRSSTGKGISMTMYRSNVLLVADWS